MFLYVYSPDDFVTPPPSEAGGAAQGGAPFTLTMRANANETLIEINDNDAVFNEVNDNQRLVSAVDLDGTTYAAGTRVWSAYDLINTANGHKVTSIHFGGNGFQQGAVDGIVSTVPLLPGQSYTFNSERTSFNAGNQYSDYIACFTLATRIRTPDGDRQIETLRPGDLVSTMDNGAQPLRWIGHRTVPAKGSYAPVHFESGTLANEAPLLVSPEHRMLVTGPTVAYYFGLSSVLVSAKSLVNGSTIRYVTGGSVTYFHMLFDRHEIVWAEGTPSEALLATDYSLNGLTSSAQAEICALFPEMRHRQTARTCLSSNEAAVLLRA